MSQIERRRTPYPWTWEIPAAIGLLTLVMTGVAAQIGRSAANLFAGGEWRFAGGRELFASLPGLLAGNAAAGLPGSMGPPASPGLLWVGIGAAELTMALLVTVAVRVLWPRLGPGRLHGVASAREAARLLGVARLRRHAAVIRPDLYGRQQARR